MADRGDPFELRLKDGVMVGYRFGAPNRPPLLFCHATGLCASVYRQMLRSIGDRYDVFAIDQRGHGRSALPADPTRLRNWEPYASDIREALDQLGARFDLEGRWTLTGHSMGGVSSLLAAGAREDVEVVRLIDPPLVPLPLWVKRTPLWAYIAARVPIARAAERRRSHWPSADAARDSYRGKRFFANWAPGVLEDYLEDGLRRDADGARLSCAPAWEAATFRAQNHDVWPSAKTHLARGGDLIVWGAGGQDSPFLGPSRRRMRRVGATVVEDAGATHLWPMERPQDAARFLVGDPL